MHVELVSIGAELLLGYTLDTNSGFFARAAAAEGIQVVRRATVDDGVETITSAVREALERTGGVITSGGLGPTADDLTKPAIAALFGRELRLDQGILDALRARWKARGWSGELPEANHAQAWIPEGAVILENRFGSAPGIWLEDAQGRWVAMLPGVPREFRGMTSEVLVPRLAAMIAKRGGEATVVRARTLRTTGIAESAIVGELGELAKDPMGVRLAYLPGWEGVDLRLMVSDVSAEQASAQLERAEAALREKVGRWIYGVEEAELTELILSELRARGMRIAVAESCTGGMLGMRLTAVPGSSDVVQGGLIAYDNAVKVRELGVRESTLAAHGAVSEEAAREMASGVRERFGVELGVSITGVAGPGGGTPEKPVGTFCVAVDLRGAVRSVRTNAGSSNDVAET